jgi:hypothetical protein
VHCVTVWHLAGDIWMRVCHDLMIANADWLQSLVTFVFLIMVPHPNLANGLRNGEVWMTGKDWLMTSCGLTSQGFCCFCSRAPGCDAYSDSLS